MSRYDEMTQHEARHEEEAGERAYERASEQRSARTDVYEAACRLGFIGDDATELSEASMVRLAYFLAQDTKKRNGAWPTPDVANAQRCWDALVRCDDEASAIDTAAVNDVFAEEIS